MGEVYRARHEKLDRDVAIKVLPEKFAEDATALARFEREAKAVAALSHPNILSIFDFGSAGGVVYAVMELLEGETLRAMLAQGPLSLSRALDFGSQIAQGLAAAHAKGVVHRDLKPENLFVTSDGRMKILDFGLARRDAPTSEPYTQAATATRQTEPGAVMGTLGYMAPEQLRGETADHRSDIFSFGAVLYEMLTGNRAFTGATGAVVMAAILKEEPADPALSRPEVPASLGRAVRRCLEKSPEARFQSARDLAFALSESAQGPSSGAIAPAPPSASAFRIKLRVVGLALAAAVLLAGLVALVPALRRRLFGPAAPARMQSLAVLPLENFSHDPAQDYFVDGITEELITNLAQIRSVRVISRTSVMAYKGTRKAIPEIAKELNVDGVLEGSVERVADRVRITAQLIEAPTDRHLWAKSYDRDLRDVLAVQSEVARAVSEEIRAVLSPQERGRLASSRQVNPEAYEAYLKGRFERNRRTADGLRQAVQDFERSVAIDPSFAPGYAGLAQCYAPLSHYGYMPHREAMEKALAAASRAVELDPQLAEAYIAMSTVHEWNWNWAEQEKAFRRGLELDPSNAQGHQWYAEYLQESGRPEEAFAEIRKAMELDPLSLVIRTAMGNTYYYARQYDAADRTLRAALELDPSFAIANQSLGLVEVERGRFEAARQALETGIRSSGGAARMRAALAYLDALSGKEDQARSFLRDNEARPDPDNSFAYDACLIRLALGEREQALQGLEKAVAARAPHLEPIAVDPRLDPLRSDARFPELVRRVWGPMAKAKATS